MLKSIDKKMTNTTDIFDRLSPSSVELLKRLNPKLTNDDEVKAGDIVLVLGRQSKEIGNLLKKLDVTSKARNIIKVPDWLVNAYHEAYLANSELVEVHHLALSLLLDVNIEKYYIAKKKISSKSTIKSDTSRYFEDISELSSLDKDAVFIGRERELTNLIVSLSSPKTKPVLLLGESGSGKTAIMYELARRIKEQRVPANLLNSRVLRIKFSAIISAIPVEGGQFPNTFLSQLLSHIAAVNKDEYEKTILFFDDLHFGMSFFIGVETINPDNDILLVGAANDDMQEKFWDSPISKMWEVVEFEEQSDADFRLILANYAKLKSSKTKKEEGPITYTDDAIKKIVEMNKNNNTKEVLPGSGIKTIDALAVYKRHISADYDLVKTLTANIKHTRSKAKINQIYKNLKQVTATPIVIDQPDVETFFITTSGGKDENKGLELSNTQLLSLEDELSKSIIGQEDAVKALSRALRVSSLKLSGSSKPIGTFLFLGPTGVGKTETAKVLAKSLFGLREGSKIQPANFIRIDMTEFTEKHTVSKLFGAPPGYVGYDDSSSLADFVAENPNSVVLFDEIDKAHPEVLTSLLHIMDEGEVRNNTGEIVSFENVIILMTSNHGAELISKEDIGFGRFEDTAAKTAKGVKAKAEWHAKIQAFVKTVMKPEFLNRFDEMIIFDQLDEESLLKILDLMLEPMNSSLKKRNIKFTITKTAKKWIVKKCNAKEYGARELRRVLNKEVADPISKILFKDENVKKIHVTVDKEELSIVGS